MEFRSVQVFSRTLLRLISEFPIFVVEMFSFFFPSVHRGLTTPPHQNGSHHAGFISNSLDVKKVFPLQFWGKTPNSIRLKSHLIPTQTLLIKKNNKKKEIFQIWCVSIKQIDQSVIPTHSGQWKHRHWLSPTVVEGWWCGLVFNRRTLVPCSHWVNPVYRIILESNSGPSVRQLKSQLGHATGSESPAVRLQQTGWKRKETIVEKWD